jgi:DNA (cytosine-5)-methyltransferase 1
MPDAFYNENDPFAAQWLRNLIAAGHIAAGDVDERSIVDVRPEDLAGRTQCHFFAGIGGWSYALRLAGWPDDRPVWTGSCPCQPFSVAGAGKGGADDRHLWPALARLIRERSPAVIFGEQVAAAIGHGWLDAVFDDLEVEKYACAAIVLPACGVGAPHIRQRLWFVAHHHHHRHRRESEPQPGLRRPELHDADGRGAVGLADRKRAGLEIERVEHARAERAAVERGGAAGELAYARGVDQPTGGVEGRRPVVEAEPSREERGGARGAWTAVDWLPCRDGKSRPVEPGTFPLAHGVPGRVGRLRAYGNAIVPQVAAEVIAAYMECRP